MNNGQINFKPEYILALIIVIWNSSKMSSECCHWKEVSDISTDPNSQISFAKNIFIFLAFLVMIKVISSWISDCVDFGAHQPKLFFMPSSHLSTLCHIPSTHLPIYHGFLTAQVLEGLYQFAQIRSPGLCLRESRKWKIKSFWNLILVDSDNSIIGKSTSTLRSLIQAIKH